MVIRNFFLTSLFFLIIANSNAQEKNDCISKYQLIKMQSSALDDIRIFLNNEGWYFDEAISNQTYNYFDYPINYNIVSWKKASYYNIGNILLYVSAGKPNVVIYQSNSFCFNSLLQSFNSIKGKTNIDNDKLVTIFKEKNTTIEFREYKNNYSSKQYSILVYNSAALFQELKIQKEKEEAIREAEMERKRNYDEALVNGDNLFKSNQFEEAKLKYLMAKDIDNNTFVQSKINLCEKAICDNLISKGDSLYSANQFDIALRIYNNAKKCSYSTLSLQEKINMTEKRILENKINYITNKAEEFLKDKKYDLALEQYNSILLLDKSSIVAAEKIKQIQSIKNILLKRSSSIFSYKFTNNSEYFQFQNNLLTDINLQISKNKVGFLNLNYLISFDTIGKNLSSVKNISTSLNGYYSYLSTISQNGILKPASEGGYFLASKDNLIFDIKWSAVNESYKSNSRGIFQSGNTSKNINTIKSFIYRQPFKYGKYIFEIKNKEFNEKSFSDINLLKYSTVGSEAALLSMLMPGMGTLKVTYGKKGWGRFTCFLLSSGLAIGSKLYSDAQYKSYLGAINQTDIDKYYNNANISHKISLIASGISASIYLYDIIWVISKGAKNIKKSKLLKKQLKQGPIQIHNQPLTY